MNQLHTTLQKMKEEFLALHERKEDLFWTVKMGIADDADLASRQLAGAEIELKRFLSDPGRLASLRALETTEDTPSQQILQGWIATLAANVVESPAGQALAEEIVEQEQELGLARARMELGLRDPLTGQLERASGARLALIMNTDPDEARRRAAYEGLREVETFVLQHGFLEIVRKRNQLGRLLGFEDYYDWRTSVVERRRKSAIFEVLDDLAQRTRERANIEVAGLTGQHGDSAREPWNFTYCRLGSLSAQLSGYFAFADSLARWGQSFTALGVKYRGATLTLDLLDRPGKYENGFMHGPGVAFFDEDRWRPARINFTSNAIPSQIGSGLRGIETLFHEGGHAAHFSNILTPAPCFAHEFAPTSIAYAETQSMFMDSLIKDADWRVLYAADATGTPLPMELIEADIAQRQPFRGWEVRAWLGIPFAERALYEMTDPTPETVLATFRGIERELQGLTAGVRPILAVPHLLAGESSAYYHGYLLAEMAVQQTRNFFLTRDGYLTDNPRIGPDLAEHYWKPGNRVPFDDTLRSLCGSSLSADALAEACNRSVDEAISQARASVEAARARPHGQKSVDLDAHVRVVHGREEIADSVSDGSFEKACARFEAWIRAHT